MRITNALNEEEIPSYTARAWSPWTVRNMLCNPGYAGRTIFKRTKARHRRDPVSGKRRRIAGLNTLSSLRQGRRYWIAVMEPGIWTVAAPLAASARLVLAAGQWDCDAGVNGGEGGKTEGR